MKSENIKNVVDRLIKSNEKAILISGSWAVISPKRCAVNPDKFSVCVF